MKEGCHKKSSRCLNCGAKVRGRYCHVCGQPVKTDRLSMRQVTVDGVQSLLRLNRGFLYTVGNLLIHPWKVIADYIHGKRVRYTAPVALLVLLAFFSVMCDRWFSTEVVKSANEESDIFLRIMTEAPALVYLLVMLPIIIPLRFVYRRYGGRRFNTAEYVVAAIYMMCPVLTVNILKTPFQGILPETVCVAITPLYNIVLGIIALLHAFPKGSAIGKAIRIVEFLLLTALTYFLIIFIIALVIAFTTPDF